MLEIADAVSDEEIESCFDVIVQLRTACERATFCDQVKRQREAGYVLTRARENTQVVAASGWRIRQNLAMGVHLYVEDLVVVVGARSRGYGAEMLRYMRARGVEAGCTTIMLDSGVQRYAAHRFYIGRRFDIRGYLFVAPLKE